MKVELNKSEDIFNHFNLDENSVYLVRVKCRANNPEHKSILFTGFKNGSYCEIYNNNYDDPIKMDQVYSMKVVKKLTKLD